jgi:hypothetical protein
MDKMNNKNIITSDFAFFPFKGGLNFFEPVNALEKKPEADKAGDKQE